MYVTSTEAYFDNPQPISAPSRTLRLPESRVTEDAFVFRQGDPVRHVYQVLSGAVRLTRVFEDGGQQLVAFGFPGDLVGFPCSGQHHTDCQALTATRLQPFRVSQISADTGDRELRCRYLEAALREIAAMQDHLLLMGRRSAVEKVAAFLLMLDERTGVKVGQLSHVDLPMSRKDIGDYLGLTTETVSRTLSQLRRLGVIALDGIYSVIVVRPDELRSLASHAEE
ncbi:helix-turn-helix domain-containing protein [Thalassococcus sp. CAU 1522]|uniref:Helix-turn-helix domain-containing protein n=1 Tax=Thalassococcus arenae TaxID=2851652 RepID=A0ABS6N532_9RHOB|nr:helix-turn-helix domain-containing protein [Thalassococcus arenae]MBV2359121.1 helix-turn-helix domain-containing protein [Thalassococcus arenae]